LIKAFSAGDPSTSAAFHVEAADLGIGSWTQGLKVTTSTSSRRLRLEVWKDSSETELLGQGILFEATVQQGPTWIHLYGGAAHPTFPEEAEEMARGRKACSNYKGSLYFTFDRWSGHRDRLVEHMLQSRRKVRLAVRLHRGLYLEMFAGKNVTLQVHLPGCGCLLSFPGKVNNEGVLNFHVGTPKPEGNAWVERRSCEVPLPNDIKHVFFYILETGQKTSKVYGKFLLHSKFTSCSWSRVVLDSSIVGELRDELAGMVLGVAALSDSAQEQPDLGGFGGFGDGVQYFGEDENFCCATSLDSMEETVSYQVKSKEKRMPFFCHVDLLAARNLIPADADGLADPYYELWIEKHRIQSPDPARRSLNPNFMHRVVVGPIDLEVDVHGEIQHLPPVTLRILDKDMEMLSSSFTVLGAAVVTNIHMFGREGPLKLNLLHQPSWYSLNGDACVPFSAGLIGDWIHAPRILMSLGMSSTREVQRFPGTAEIFSNSSATIETLNAEEWQHYEINLPFRPKRCHFGIWSIWWKVGWTCGRIESILEQWLYRIGTQ